MWVNLLELTSRARVKLLDLSEPGEAGHSEDQDGFPLSQHSPRPKVRLLSKETVSPKMPEGYRIIYDIQGCEHSPP